MINYRFIEGFEGLKQGDFDEYDFHNTINLTALDTINNDDLEGYFIKWEGDLEHNNPYSRHIQVSSIGSLTIVYGSKEDFEEVQSGRDPENAEHQYKDVSINVTMDADKQIESNFEPIEYDLNINIEGNGTLDIKPEKQKYNYGDQVTITAWPEEGYEFYYWTGDLMTHPRSQEIDITITQDTYLSAKFGEPDQQDYYTLTMEVEGDGHTQPPEGVHEVPQDTDVDLKAIENNTADFIQWKGHFITDEKEGYITVDDHKKVIASFVDKDDPSDCYLWFNRPDHKEVFTIRPGFTITVYIEAECSCHGQDDITYRSHEMPVGSELDSTWKQSPNIAKFTWTPSYEDIGTHQVIIGANCHGDEAYITLPPDDGEYSYDGPSGSYETPGTPGRITGGDRVMYIGASSSRMVYRYRVNDNGGYDKMGEVITPAESSRTIEYKGGYLYHVGSNTNDIMIYDGNPDIEEDSSEYIHKIDNIDSFINDLSVGNIDFYVSTEDGMYIYSTSVRYNFEYKETKNIVSKALTQTYYNLYAQDGNSSIQVYNKFNNYNNITTLNFNDDIQSIEATEFQDNEYLFVSVNDTVKVYDNDYNLHSEIYLPCNNCDIRFMESNDQDLSVVTEDGVVYVYDLSEIQGSNAINEDTGNEFYKDIHLQPYYTIPNVELSECTDIWMPNSRNRTSGIATGSGTGSGIYITPPGSSGYYYDSGRRTSYYYRGTSYYYGGTSYYYGGTSYYYGGRWIRGGEYGTGIIGNIYIGGGIRFPTGMGPGGRIVSGPGGSYNSDTGEVEWFPDDSISPGVYEFEICNDKGCIKFFIEVLPPLVEESDAFDFSTNKIGIISSNTYKFKTPFPYSYTDGNNYFKTKIGDPINSKTYKFRTKIDQQPSDISDSTDGNNYFKTERNFIRSNTHYFKTKNKYDISDSTDGSNYFKTEKYPTSSNIHYFKTVDALDHTSEELSDFRTKLDSEYTSKIYEFKTKNVFDEDLGEFKTELESSYSSNVYTFRTVTYHDEDLGEFKTKLEDFYSSDTYMFSTPIAYDEDGSTFRTEFGKHLDEDTAIFSTHNNYSEDLGEFSTITISNSTHASTFRTRQ